MQERNMEVFEFKLDPEHFRLIDETIKYLGGDGGPPSLGCDCTMCKFKVSLVTLAHFDPKFFASVLPTLKSKEAEWKKEGEKMWRTYVNAFFEGPIKDAIEDGLWRLHKAKNPDATRENVHFHLDGAMLSNGATVEEAAEKLEQVTGRKVNIKQARQRIEETLKDGFAIPNVPAPKLVQ